MGAYALVHFEGEVSATASNAVVPSLKMRKVGTSAWTDVTLTNADKTYTGTTKVVVEKVVPADDAYSWEFLAIIEDSANASASAGITISVGYATIDFKAGGKGISFGTTAVRDGFVCAMDTEFSGDVYLGATNLATALALLGGLDFTSVKIRVGTQTVVASVGTQQKIFTYADLDTLFGTTNTSQTNCLVLAVNGHWEAHNSVINGTINKTDGVYMYSASGFLGANFRFNYIAIRF